MNSLKLATAILGENYSVLSRSSVKAQQKVRGLFGILLIPALLWGLGGFGVSYSLMECGLWTSLVTCILSAWLILKVDLAFMQLGSKDKWSGSNLYRFAIVLIGCTINSLLVDSLLFEQDYLQIANRLHLEEVNQTYHMRTADLRKQLDELKTSKSACQMERDSYLGSYIIEMEGTGGSGQRGLGSIAKAKQAAYEQAESKLVQISGDVNRKETELLAMQAQDLQEGGNPGLFTKLEALVEHTFFSGKLLMFFIWLFMFVFVIMLEFSPMIFKSRMGDTDYDVWKATDELNKKRSMEMEAERIRRMHERLSAYSAADWRVIEKMKAA